MTTTTTTAATAYRLGMRLHSLRKGLVEPLRYHPLPLVSSIGWPVRDLKRRQSHTLAPRSVPHATIHRSSSGPGPETTTHIEDRGCSGSGGGGPRRPACDDSQE